jgi:SulP family sulfate permease
MLKRLKVGRPTFVSDAVSGLVLSLITIPGDLANGLLAGVNPVNGLYSLITGMTVGALFTSSVLMAVDSTSATALATFEALGGFSSDQKTQALVVLTLMAGLFQLIFGLLKLGFLTRFISNSVMTGFLTGIAINTILGQVGDLTGYDSDAPNRVFRAIDTFLHPRDISWPTFVFGLLTMLIIALVNRTRYERFSMLIGIGVVTVLVGLAQPEGVALVGDTTQIPQSLPTLHLPDLSLAPALIAPALAIAIVALVQASGVSQSVPNPDGRYPDPSGDFRGQGLANVSAGLFSGVAVGGSLSATQLVRQVGGKSRWANLLTGLFAAVAVLLFANLIELLPMTGLAALLVMIGFSLINRHRIATVWQTGNVSRVIFLVTLVATMFLSIQVAVAIGVVLHIFTFMYREADKVRIERLVLLPDRGAREEEAPAALPSNEVTVLVPVGSLFFAGAAEFEEHLPDPTEAHNATVILRLRDRDELGSTFIRVLERYAQRLKDTGNRLILAGVSTSAYDQLQGTGVLDVIGADNIFTVKQEYGASLREAMLVAGGPQALSTASRLQSVEANLQQAVTLISAEAEQSQVERRVRLERNRDELTPIVSDISAMNVEEMPRANLGASVDGDVATGQVDGDAQEP